MAEIVKGRNVKVEIAATFAPVVVVDNITNASPGVAHSTAHGLNNGEVGYMESVEGMVQLEGQAVRVTAKTADNFSLQGLNTTAFSAFSGLTDFKKASTWVTLAEATSYQIGGGGAEKLDTTALIDSIKKEENGLLAAQSLDLGVNALTTPSAAMALVEAAAQAGSKLLFRITLQDGSLRLCFGEPSLPGENVQKGQVGTGNFSVTVKGFILKLPAAA